MYHCACTYPTVVKETMTKYKQSWNGIGVDVKNGNKKALVYYDTKVSSSPMPKRMDTSNIKYATPAFEKKYF